MKAARPALGGAQAPLVSAYDVVLLDLDGVVYVGDQALPGVAETIAEVTARGCRVGYVTNNSSRTVDAVVAHLHRLGLSAEPSDVITSAQAAAGLVVDRWGGRARVLPIGGEGLRVALGEAGCTLVGSADDRADVVVQGYSPDLRYADLAEAALAVARGAGWVATNRDRTLPTARGIQPGNGALVGAVAEAVGHGPDAFAGKPDPALLEVATRRTGAARPLMVGDRLDTDIEGARRVAMDSLWVATGVDDGAAVVTAPPERRPTYLGQGLGALLAEHPMPTAAGDAVVCGGWRVRPLDEDHRLLVDGSGHSLDLLRAVAQAAWIGAAHGSPRLEPGSDDAARAAAAAGLGRLLASGGGAVG